MTQPRRIRAKPGDIFAMPLSPDKVGYGQIVAGDRIVFFMATFDYTTLADEPSDLSALVRAPVLLLGNFLDGAIKRGKWKLIGNIAPDTSRIPIPCFKVNIGGLGLGGAYYVESWDMKKRRRATELETALLDNRRDYSPACLEEALKAYYGLAPRPKWYEEMTLEHVLARSNIAF